ncbi:LLM class flavin-dependent oxidoreductase [Leptospira idonii]|uniref:Luciferase-like monooxygenase n=1 Tax=Leptospira idonii TaxID=1193500 RepID=A0A4R9LZ92_9LEPT|nr:LLM class flavin-dependent oxidoreductase [Leptospira idonii]TGN18229.1 LLM class flavin-dependent oxidoreductase [Leptospira idonii]
MNLSEIPLSVLDLSPIVSGSDTSVALHNSLTLAKKSEELGYNRFWLAEHHNMPGIASAATSVIIGHIAGGTSRIRVGSGGIMLPNHAPIVIAEQFGTLDALYPGRIDLGLGRAPGTDQTTTQALRRDQISGGVEFSDLLEELRYFLAEPYPGQKVKAIPAMGREIPIWLLGSSGYSAELAGRLGLPFSFAGHFAPEQMMYAVTLYRRVFQPSEHLEKPYMMMGANVLCADTNEEAEILISSQILSFLSLIKGNPKPMEPPVKNYLEKCNVQEKAFIEQRLSSAIIGDKNTVKQQLNDLIQRTGADELIINTMVYDFEKRLKSYEILMEAKKEDCIRV